MKIGDRTINQLTWFKYFGYIIDHTKEGRNRWRSKFKQSEKKLSFLSVMAERYHSSLSKRFRRQLLDLQCCMAQNSEQ